MCGRSFATYKPIAPFIHLCKGLWNKSLLVEKLSIIGEIIYYRNLLSNRSLFNNKTGICLVY